MVSWFINNTDLVGMGIALMAIIVSLVTVMISRRQQQANSFLVAQELMMRAELQRGRLLVYNAGSTGQLPPADSEDFYLITRALSIFDLIGTYARRGLVRRRWVLDYWHPRLQVIREGYNVVHSRTYGPYPSHARPDLLDLIDRAERYMCRRSCCANGRREQRLRGHARKNTSDEWDVVVAGKDVSASEGEAASDPGEE